MENHPVMTDELILDLFNDDNGEPNSIRIGNSYVFVGRDPRADIVLNNPEMLSRVFYCQLIEGCLFGIALVTGVVKHIDGRDWESGWIRETDIFQVEGQRFRLRIASESKPAHTSTNPIQPDILSTIEYQLEIVHSKSGRRFDSYQKLLLIGRLQPSNLRVNHSDLSFCHAAILQNQGTYHVIDLMSRLGTFVNGKQITFQELHEGDEIKLGSVSIRFRRTENALAVVQPNRQSSTRKSPWTTTNSSAGESAALDRILEQASQFQKQTFEQFQTAFQSTMEMASKLISEQRQASREEIERLERIIMALTSNQRPDSTVRPPHKPSEAPKPAALEAQTITLTKPFAAPEPRMTQSIDPSRPTPPADSAGFFSWMEDQLESVRKERTSAWDRLLRVIKGS